MYINQFLVGVVATILAEIIVMIVAIIVVTRNKNEKNPATDQGKQDSNNT